MTIKKISFYLFFLFFSGTAFSQLTEDERELVVPTRKFSPSIDYSGELNMKGMGSTGEKLPFWMYSNRRGRVSEGSNLSTWASGRAVTFFRPESFLIIGGGLLFDDGANKGIVVDELYAYYQNPWLRVTAGRKQRPELYNGLSTSNKSILWSLNARPMPGLELSSNGPIFFVGNDGLGFEASYGHYFMGKDRYVKSTQLHHKSLGIVYRWKNKWQVKLGYQHYVQWGGVSPRWGQLPDSFDDYYRAVLGFKGGNDATKGDQLNALGNTVGGFELYFRRKFKNFDLEIFYNHLFEDGTGTRFVNLPDGRYGIFIEHRDQTRIVNSLMYELIYTNNQSYKTLGIHKYDNYFNHGVYSSGWTYENRVIGAPFFTVDTEEPGLSNNKFTTHHLGIGGTFSNYFHNYPYKLLLSYAYNDGTYFERFRPKQEVFYVSYEMTLLQKIIGLKFQLGAEYNSYASPIYGAGIHLSYEMF